MSVTAMQSVRIPFGLSLGAWIERLVERFPDFDEYDLSQMVEEKTGIPVFHEDFQAIRAFYLRAKLQAWSPERDEGED